MGISLFAAQTFGALIALAHSGVCVIDKLVTLRAGATRADLVEALTLFALAPATLDVIGVANQGVTVGVLVGVAVDLLRGVNFFPIVPVW